LRLAEQRLYRLGLVLAAAQVGSDLGGVVVSGGRTSFNGDDAVRAAHRCPDRLSGKARISRRG
jgi:hypothetical protein